MFKRIRDIAAATIFGFVTMCAPVVFFTQSAHADLKGIEITSDTPLPMYHVSSSTLNLQSNTSLQQVPDLTQDLTVGDVYTCHAHLLGASGAGGLQTVLSVANSLTASPVKTSTIIYNGNSVVTNITSTSLGAPASTSGTYTDVIIDSSFTVTHSGTIQVQAAQNTSNAAISSVAQGSTFSCIHVPSTTAMVIQQGTPPMAAPFNGGASPNGNNYATGCNLGSCLAAEDVFQSTTLSSSWNSFFASGALTGTYAQNTDSYTVNGGAVGLSLTGQDSASYNAHCIGSSLATNPPYTSCGTGTASTSNFYGLVTFADTYFHPDTTHLFGDGFQFNVVATPAPPIGAFSTCGTDAACSKGAVWKSSAISSAHGCTAYAAGCFVLPSTGGYIQTRLKLPDSGSGAMPSISLLADATGTIDAGQEIDLHQGGFNYTPSGGSAVPANRVMASSYRTAGHVFQTNTGPSPYTVTVVGGTTYLVFSGSVPAALQVGMDVFDVTNPPAIPTTNNVACITNITAPNVQLGDCSGGNVATNTINSATPDDIWFGIGQVQNLFCSTNTTDGDITATGFPTGGGAGTTAGTGSFSCERDVGSANDMSAGYHIYGIEYIPGTSITIYFDNTKVAQWSGAGIGTSAYDVVMYLDVANSVAANGNWHTAEAWPTTSPPGSVPATSYTMQVNDIQLYKLPTGGGGGGGGAQAVVMNAPNLVGAGQTQLGNYATGCPSSPGAAASVTSNASSCLMFDDHWDGTGTSSSPTALNLSHWAPGIVACNPGASANCTLLFDGATNNNIPLPLTEWCTPGAGGCFDNLLYPFNYGTTSATTFSIGSFIPAQVVGDGSLALGVKDVGAVSYCTGEAAPDCWVGGVVFGGGNPNNNGFNFPFLNATIPIGGGMVQWRMKTDNGVLVGAYPGVQCSAIAGSWSSNSAPDSNANFEFGYLSQASGGGVPDARSFGNGENDTAVQTSSIHTGNNYVTTGDINPNGSTPGNQGTGDTRNWHVYALEWINSPAPGAAAGTGQWYYYVDGVSQPVTPITSGQGGDGVHGHVETRIPTVGWACSFTQDVSNSGFNSFHSMWTVGNPGPFYLYFSDIQFWKKPTG